MATPISLARGVLTPRRRASCSQGSEGGVLAPRAARGARSPTPRSPEELKSASSRTLSPEEDVPVTSTESPAEILSKFRLYDLGSQELVDLRLQDLEHRVQALERAYEVSKESNGAKLQEPFQRKGLHSEEKLWDELTAKLHAEASRQASVLACKTEQQLAMVDRQLAELLGKAQALIQQSAAQEEERLSVQSGHMLQEIRAQLGLKPSQAGWSHRRCTHHRIGPTEVLEIDQAEVASTAPGMWQLTILPKLFNALGKNTHLKHLLLGNTALESGKACVSELAAALRSNSTLLKLDLQANYLEMEDLKTVFEALADNKGVKELKLNLQACRRGTFKDLLLEQAGKDVYKAAAEVFSNNRSLVKLDLMLLHRHWQDQICRGLMQNKQERRRLEKKDACRQADGVTW
ncbi:unnamed protein product [Effrenium voratum]|nr:unnamed protein product [Effrenium voratum]